MSSFRRETTRAFRWLVLSMMVAGVMAPAASAAVADHLIISEVLIKTRTPFDTFGSPFIEIVNPTGSPIPMDNVYLTDGATSPSTYYYNIALLDPATANPGGGVGGDFHARFPAGYVLAAGDSLAISLNGSTEYLAAYGRNPDFELFEDGIAPDAVPELLEAYQGSINAGLGGAGNVPVLSDVAESLVLYSWDGTTDLVQDLDYLMWGSNTSARIDKTGVVIGAGTYLAETPIASQEAAAAAGPTFNSVMRRVDGDEGTEAVTGGNGITGHDETSENLATTFPTVVGHEPPLANPAFPAAPIFTAGGFAPAEPSDGQAVVLTISVVDQDAVDAVVFHYSVDGGADQTLNGSQTSATDWTATVPGQVENSVVTWYCVATNTEATTAIYPAGSPQFAAFWTTGAAVIPGDGPAKLLLTEISTIGTDQEFIEIYNPGAEDVDLTDYYITDANYATGDQFYYRIGEGNPTQVTVGGGAFSDFHARFPAGFTIAAGDTIVLTVAGSTLFNGQFGFDPDLELWEDGGAPDAVPDMLPIFGTAGDNSIISSGSTPTLTNGAETVILYHFITGEDKVTDIDVFAWKDPSSTTTSHFFNKTGVTVGSHSYLNENGTNVSDAFGTQNEFGNSYHRTDANEGDQTPTGSNGVDGRDETSENFNTTFAMMPYDPSSPSGPPPVIDPEKLLITQVCTKDTGAEFIEIHNPSAFAVNMGDYYLTDAIYSPGNQFYWRIAEGNPTGSTVGGGAFGDFHANFPAGYSLAAGDTITVAVGGSTAFNATYGYLPDLELYEDDAAADDVPDMAYIFGDATNNSIINRTGSGSGQPSNPGLTDSAETVVLYNWRSTEDRVVDIDVFIWKDASSSETSFLFDKNGVTVGSHTYLPDTPIGSQTPFGTEAASGFSYHRTDGSEGTQAPTGSNGVGGRDETSENFTGTFGSAPADPARPPGPPVEGDAKKLLLTEICTTGTDQEFVEIYNPGSSSVDLSDYYLTDAIYSTGQQFYWRIAQGNPSQSTVGGGAYFDFHARFPDGFNIGAGDTIVVSIAGSIAYSAHFGFDPDLELFEDGGSPDEVLDMRYVFGDDLNNSIINTTGTDSGQPSTPGLTNGGETVILYHWTTGEDKVTDIDVFAYKDPSYNTTSFFFNKTGQTIGSHSYLNEQGTNEGRAFGSQASFGNSYHRIDPNEGAQTPTGSNGVGGRDETSEDFRNTFELAEYDPSRPSGAPVVGVAAKLLLTEISTSDTAPDFIEIHNPGSQSVDLSGFYLTDAVKSPDQVYWNIALGNPSGATVGGGADGDFHAGFPAGFSIRAGSTIVISVGGGADFNTAYGFLPDLKLLEGDADDDNVDVMDYIFGDDTTNSIFSATSTPDLANEAGTVVLYHFLPTEDKVTDVDVFAWKGASSSMDIVFDKTGVTIGGHDYLPEMGTSDDRAYTAVNAEGDSYQRKGAKESGQVGSGSNGVNGRDETSEDFNKNFTSRASAPGEFNPTEGEKKPVYDSPLWVPAKTFLPNLGEEFPITFFAPPEGETETRLRIFDLEGRVVVTLFDSRFDGDPPGTPEHPSNPIYWDGRDSFFELVKGGMYVVHLSLVDIETGKMETQTAPVVVGTRLSN